MWKAELHKDTFHLLVHTLNGCSDQGWARLKPVSGTSFQYFTWVQEYKHLGQRLVLSQTHQEGAALEMEELRFALALQRMLAFWVLAS